MNQCCKKFNPQPKGVFYNLSSAEIVEQAIKRGEGRLMNTGSLLFNTQPRTGRSPKDKFLVRTEANKDLIWWGNNAPITEENFDKIYKKISAYVESHDMFVYDGYAGADPKFRYGVRIMTQYASHNLFVRNMFIGLADEELEGFKPDFTIIDCPDVKADPATEGTNSEAFVLLNLDKNLIIIGGSKYGGEIKKSAFSYMNYVLPLRHVLTMHCSANMSHTDGSTALFFGLSGTGKTTLSADHTRKLIGDDEHGWGDDGVFNFEGGCYAKCIDLTHEKEPQIYDAIRFGSIVENVVCDKNGTPDFADASITENTRTAYPLNYIENAVIPSVGGHPKYVILLTADATGVMPPVAKLTEAQAMYHYMSGYTSRVAGTETGITEPQPVFSACFGAPFLPLSPAKYAEMLGQKLKKHNTTCYLINTGWTGGPAGKTGKRMSLPYTRAIVNSVLDGLLEKGDFVTDPIFGFAVPKSVPGVPSEVLQPRSTWPNPADYDAAAKKLAEDFSKNFSKFEASDEIRNAGPKAK
ncbi:MAG: phosphoenolpyruvate carboxykinase (ATP) [Candidatus Sumerlaeales bacterium]|nr:phosphoenolpyruvate carboxykinase (ATP) [Candidatus Sumerlaeales bacterium]